MKTDNEVIAEFLGWKRQEDWGSYYNTPYGDVILADLKFHKSFDWLMPIVEKIEKLGHQTAIIGGDVVYPPFCSIGIHDGMSDSIVGSGTSKIETIYKAVILWIHWYNSQEKK